jgi:hypothetical protein
MFINSAISVAGGLRCQDKGSNPRVCGKSNLLKNLTLNYADYTPKVKEKSTYLYSKKEGH